MTNAPDSRKTHIVRIVGINKDGDRLDDIWVDIERIDIIKGAMQIPPDFQWQGYQRKLRWCDDPDNGEEYSPDGTPSRLTEVIKVCDPESDNIDDPDEWVPVRVTKGMRSKGGGSESMGQGFMDRFVNEIVDGGDNIARISEVRKIVHYDTSIDDAAQAAFDGDESRTQYVVDADFYIKDISSKDDDQYVEHEIVKFYKPKGNSEKVAGIGRQTKLLNDYLIDESEPAAGTVVGASGINPPYRLDPFQNIINVKFTGVKAVLVGLQPSAFIFGGSASGVYTDDGLSLRPFGANTCAASGFGRTVVVGSVVAGVSDYVAFGKPRDGKSCFIVVRGSGGAIERGVMENGDLSWTGIGSLPGDIRFVYSCQFAGGAFFIGYKTNDSLFRFAVSFDGLSFAQDIDPFPGADSHANGTNESGNTAQIEGGGVAYDSQAGQYVTVAYFARFFSGTFNNGVTDVPFDSSDANFCSSISNNGLSWSPHFDDSETGIFGDGNGVGRIGGAVFPNCSVAFGNGRFVACAARKVAIIDPEFFNLASSVQMAAAAVSVNGTNWSGPIDLPGALEPAAHHQSSASAVIFCKHRGLGPGIDGFFLMGAIGHGTDDLPAHRNIFYSIDGSAWSEVYRSIEFLPFYMSLLNKQTDSSILVQR